MRALSPRAMTGQPIRWGAVGASKTARNHSAVTGWKQAKVSGGGLERSGDITALTLLEHSAGGMGKKRRKQDALENMRWGRLG